MINIENLNKAILLTQNENFIEAENLYKDMLKEEPDNHIILSAIGLFYVNIQKYSEAINFLNKACKIKKTLGTVSALGFAEYEQNNFEKAAEILEQALALGENAEIYNKLILCFFHTKNYAKAIEYSSIMHQKYPENTNAIANMVKSLTHSGKLFEAEKLCVNFLQENQDSSSLWFHLGYLKELIYSDDKQACECYKRALQLGNPEAFYNIAVSYQKQRDFNKAEMFYNKMLQIYPQNIDTITSLGMCKLTQKKFKEGYDLFFKREKVEYNKRTSNPWKPDKNFEKEILVFCDQGFGDHIQFIRYLPLLKEKVEKIYVASNHSLITLFKKNYPQIEFITYDQINPKMQSICITDLAFALNIDFDNIPFPNGYLESEQNENISEKLNVGLCWEAGSAGIRTMINRTININLFEKFFKLPNIQFYSFQVQDTFKGNEKYTQMINLAKDFNNFEDTAKALKSMELVISVDTSVAHLAGALGIKTFLMLPYASDWRWFDDTQTTPWYNSVKIFKQSDPISWEKPMEDIICQLKEYSS